MSEDAAPLDKRTEREREFLATLVDVFSFSAHFCKKKKKTNEKKVKRLKKTL